MEVAFVQFSPAIAEKSRNREKMLAFVHEAASRRVDLLIFPELSLTGYALTSGELHQLSETVPGPATREIARATKGISVVLSLPEKEGESYFITSVLLRDGRIVGKYRKSHLFENEKLLFTPGGGRYEVLDTPEARVGLLICYDWWFPESSRTLALKGAQIICYSACLMKPYAARALATRAVENKVFVILSSRVGSERGITFQGQSQIIGPNMEVLAAAEKGGESLLSVSIDPGKADNKKVIARSDLFQDRREDLYFK